MRRRTFVHRLAALGCAAAPWLPASSQANPLKIVVPFAPGAGSDAMARYFGSALGVALGRQVVVENRTGAGGAIGTDAVAKAAPDGNTLLFIASPFTTAAATGQKPAYDPTAFAPVAIMGKGPLMFAANVKVPGRDLREVMEEVKRNPAKLNYGSAGVGSVNHLILELLKQQTGSYIVHIPYRGIAAATTDLIAGQVHLLTGSVPALMPFVKEGRIKPLALTTAERAAAVPGVPGMRELGFKDFDVNNYWGFAAPPQTPLAVTQALNQALNNIVVQADVRARLLQDATEPETLGVDAVGRFIAADYVKWKKLIQSGKLNFDS
jgi:tripartite-type tricarboxylate transporter receptor subunit TctC